MNCNFCDVPLDDSNWYPSSQAKRNYICNTCKGKKEYGRCKSNSLIHNALDKILECLDCNAALNENNWLPYDRAKCFRICKECNKKRKNKQNLLLKEQTIVEYGGKCACCGDKNIIFLTVDHINGNGSEHRKSIQSNYKMTGTNFYRWLRKHNYPKDNYQILCFNCNFAKHTLGICPHQHTK